MLLRAEGVLLEEAVRTCLGKEGELALIDEGAFNPIDPYDTRRQRALAYSQSQREAANLRRESGQAKKKRKREETKVIKSEDEGEGAEVKELVGEGEGKVTKKGKKRGGRKKAKKHREKDQVDQPGG